MSSPSSLRSLRVLVAEDDPPGLYLLVQTLEARGHHVTGCVDGPSALAAALAQPFDLIVSDALMPGLDGFQLCLRIRQNPALRDTVFVLYTATYTDSSDADLALQFGADHFLIKPDENERLFKIVDQVAAGAARPPRSVQEAPTESELLRTYSMRVAIKLELKLNELRRSEQTVLTLNDQLRETVRKLETEVVERRRSAELLRLAQSVGGIGSWVLDSAQSRLALSDEAAAILGQPVDQAALDLGDLLARIPADDVSAARATLAGWQHEETPCVCEFRYLRPGETQLRHLHFRSEVFHNPRETPRRIGIVQDITERKAAEARQEATEARLRQSQKMEAVGNLAGGIAHDFNNLLTAILPRAELITLSTEGIDAETCENAREIITAAQRGRDIVSQILTFSRQQTVERRPLAIAPAIEEALRILAPAMPPSVKLISEIDRGTGYILANAGQLHQVVLNLCTNAAQAIAPLAGEVRVTLRRVDIDADTAQRHPPLRVGPHIELAVTDTGAGIDPAIIGRIFDPFFTTKPIGKGTGLGLAVVHGIIQHHDAAITVMSTPGASTTFRVWFAPCAAPVNDTSTPFPFAPSAPGRGRRTAILFVDDEPSVASIAVNLLGRMGYQAECVTDPMEARDLLLNEPGRFDLVITDYAMPRMNGVQLAQTIWATQPNQCFIMAAGYGGSLDADRVLALGFRDYVTKPFSMDSLRRACLAACPPLT